MTVVAFVVEENGYKIVNFEKWFILWNAKDQIGSIGRGNYDLWGMDLVDCVAVLMSLLSSLSV